MVDWKKILLLLVYSLLLVACQSQVITIKKVYPNPALLSPQPNNNITPVPRGQTIIIVGDHVSGTFNNDPLGKKMDILDHMRLDAILNDAKEKHETGWVNEFTHLHYKIFPEKKIIMTDGTICRNFNANINSAGFTEKHQGQACLQPGTASWEIKSIK